MRLYLCVTRLFSCRSGKFAHFLRLQ
jgi:hypothetical protein